MGEKSKPLAFPVGGGGTITIPCRGLSYASVKQTKRSFFHVCQKLKCDDPFEKDSTLVDRMTFFKSGYIVRAPTRPYDPLDFIPKAFDGIDNLAWCPLKKVMAKTIQLLSCHHGLRTSSLGRYCPYVEDILLPPSTERRSWCIDGLPVFIVIGYRMSKSRKPSERGDRDRVWLMVHRNMRSPSYCTMTWIFFWLAVSGITAGPLFVVIKNKQPLIAAKKVSVRRDRVSQLIIAFIFFF